MKVLVTGGSGTIGRMVCKKLKEQGHEPVSLIRNPANQHIFCPGIPFQVGYIEDYHDVYHVMRKHAVEAVIHTAANKHVSVCEDQPSEAVSSNVVGSLNVLRAIEELKGQVKRAVFVSSDKACNNTQVYGITKALMEKLVKEYASRVSAKINCVRFGNVFGSSGSVLPIWENKIARGQDIELRMWLSQVPLRFGILPSEAAEFCINVFASDGFEGGSVIMRHMNVINIRTMAEVMTDNSRSKIIIRDVEAGEAQQELLFSESERQYLKTHEGTGYIEIVKHPQADPPKFSNQANRGVQLDHEDTKKFVNIVLKEMKEWTEPRSCVSLGL
jgi:UDP-N-acetylglucosamine 4,6-dehydratase